MNYIIFVQEIIGIVLEPELQEPQLFPLVEPEP